MIPKHSRRKAYLAPDQIFSAGFRAGQTHQNLHPQFRHHPQYLKGYAQGYRAAKSGAKSEETSVKPPAPLVSFFSWSDLDGALHSIQRWEADQAQLGFGTVALGFNNGWWLVLISEDLYDAVLPF